MAEELNDTGAVKSTENSERGVDSSHVASMVVLPFGHSNTQARLLYVKLEQRPVVTLKVDDLQQLR